MPKILLRHSCILVPWSCMCNHNVTACSLLSLLRAERDQSVNYFWHYQWQYEMYQLSFSVSGEWSFKKYVESKLEQSKTYLSEENTFIKNTQSNQLSTGHFTYPKTVDTWLPKWNPRGKFNSKMLYISLCQFHAFKYCKLLQFKKELRLLKMQVINKRVIWGYF